MNKALYLVSHVCDSIAKANNEVSLIDKKILDIDGMSTNKIRHLFNNLCSMPNTKYLEVGSWKGSTLCSALSNNRLDKAVAYENFAEFTDNSHQNGKSIKNHLLENISTFKGDNTVEVRQEDYFSSVLPNEKFNIYFYDGAHNFQTQYHQIGKAKSILDKYSIHIIDDWFCEVSKTKFATQKAFQDYNFYIHFFAELPRPEYHGGQGIFVLENL
jgi:hypothetical protein